MVASKSVEVPVPGTRWRAARPSTVKAALLELQPGRNTCVRWERYHRPRLMVCVKFLQHVYSLHQSQLPGREKRRTEDLKAERRPCVTWGSPTSRKGYGDGGTVVLKSSP